MKTSTIIEKIFLPAGICIVVALWQLTGWPNYVGASIVVILCALFFGLLIWRAAALSEPELRILALMLIRNAAHEQSAFQVPVHVIAGTTAMFGKGEGPATYAPVANRYLGAFRKLVERGLIVPMAAGSPIYQLTEQGAKAAQRAPLAFRNPPLECNGG